ncbi:hypothetical protein WDV06_21305 [Streptomyces racemochromogenes]|uniref:Secreted protein n=1 Tax=Streptomyces racemochromogenes TaxID=67353 RepID=A0ABW7PGV4_9ACTN
MNGSRKLALGAAAMALTIGGAFAVTSASAEPTRTGKAAATSTAFAKVRADGVILAWSGMNSVQHVGTGRYLLSTNTDITYCALLGTVNKNNFDDPGPGSSSILVGQAGPTTIFIRTATPSSGGSRAVDDDRPFSVSVVC